MGPWRALMGRARGRPRYLSPSSASSSSSLPFSSSSVSKAEQHQPCPPAPIARFEIPSHESLHACAQRIWAGSGLGFPSLIFSEKNARQNGEALLQDAKDFLLDSSSEEGLRRPDLRSSEGSLQTLEQKKARVTVRASPAEFAAGTLSFQKPWLNAGTSLFDTKALLTGFLQKNALQPAEDHFRFSLCNSAIRAPGFYGSEDFVIQADSVKRKRKKKMNKHKHRKLRRLARKSHK